MSVNEIIVSISAALKGCTDLPRLVDNGDGTITDNDTRLTWETNSEPDGTLNPADLHDGDNMYWWSGVCVSSLTPCQPNPVAVAGCAAGADGVPYGCGECDDTELCGFGSSGIATIWDWIAALKADAFAGYNDWRVPTRGELLSLTSAVDATCTDADATAAPCVRLIEAVNWSATTLATDSNQAWVVGSEALPGAEGKLGALFDIGPHAVMAVRGGPLGGGRCPGDHDGSGGVSVDELVASVSNALRGCGARFIDNGDGTISDGETGLIWEKKIARDGERITSSLHDADNPYVWAGACSDASTTSCQPDPTASRACNGGVDGDPGGCSECAEGDGTCITSVPTVWIWLAQLNASGFAGHMDWRLPTLDELRTIVAYERSVAPTIDVAFDGSRCGRDCLELSDSTCSCTTDATYWSASGTGDDASVVTFLNGAVRTHPKTSLEFPPRARAVRSGS